MPAVVGQPTIRFPKGPTPTKSVPVKKPPSPARINGLTPALRRYLAATAGVTGGAIMIIEILGAKMLAPYIGTSHFVWTAQIGVTLVALMTGYAVGGRIADRSPQLRWLFGAILLAAVSLTVTVLVVERVAYACLAFELAMGSLLASAALFFLPLALLATVPPFLVRMLTASLETVGTSAGRLSAISAGGSVIGTVLIGYVLIPFLPNAVTMYATAGLLMLMAVAYFAVWERGHLPPAILSGLVAAGIGFVGVAQPSLAQPPGLTEVYRRNSDFGLMQVVEDTSGRRYYLNDLLTQNSYLPATRQSAALFTHMLHGLAKVYTPAIREALCVGMGVGIVPMQLAREGVAVDVVEINPDVVPLAERFFDFDRSKVNLTIGDGRYFVARTTARYDTIILDAFLGESPPSHLMTCEALSAMKTRLKPGGTLVMNMFGEFASGRDFFVASLDRTLREVFPSVRVHAAGNGNTFFVASAGPALAFLREPDLEGVPTSLRWRVEAAYAGQPRIDSTHGRVLTDAFNPVDFYDAANREELRKQLANASRAE